MLSARLNMVQQCGRSTARLSPAGSYLAYIDMIDLPLQVSNTYGQSAFLVVILLVARVGSVTSFGFK